MKYAVALVYSKQNVIDGVVQTDICLSVSVINASNESEALGEAIKQDAEQTKNFALIVHKIIQVDENT